MTDKRVFHDVRTLMCEQSVSGEDTDQWCNITYKKHTLEGKIKKEERLENIDEVTSFHNAIDLSSVYISPNSYMATYFSFNDNVDCVLENKIIQCYIEL